MARAPTSVTPGAAGGSPATPAVTAIHHDPPPEGFEWKNIGGIAVLARVTPPAAAAPAAAPAAAATPTTATPTTAASTSTTASTTTAEKKDDGAMWKTVIICGTVLAVAFMIFGPKVGWWTGSGGGNQTYNAPPPNGQSGGGGQQGVPSVFQPRSGQPGIQMDFAKPRGYGADSYRHNCSPGTIPVVTGDCWNGPRGLKQCRIECR